MFNFLKNITILVILLTITMPFSAKGDMGYIDAVSLSTEIKPLPSTILPQNLPSPSLKKSEKYLTFSDWLNAKYTITLDKKEERKRLREEWKQALGIDIFYPYFKAEEIKDKVEEKFSVKVFKINGKARLERDEAKYIFSVKF